MTEEVETKLRLSEREAFELIDLCSKKSKGIATSQRDEYYDFSNRLLREKDFTVRLRVQNDIPLIALKSPRIHSLETYKRIELEFQAESEAKVREELSSRDLRVFDIIEKKRTQFSLENGEIVVDQVPHLGYFCEVESNSEEAVEEIIDSLNLGKKSHIAENYTELLRLELNEGKLDDTPIRAEFGA